MAHNHYYPSDLKFEQDLTVFLGQLTFTIFESSEGLDLKSDATYQYDYCVYIKYCIFLVQHYLFKSIMSPFTVSFYYTQNIFPPSPEALGHLFPPQFGTHISLGPSKGYCETISKISLKIFFWDKENTWNIGYVHSKINNDFELLKVRDVITMSCAF
ncbi:hypothetical protein AMTRI_Chr02g255700 [Amborella trichopoda]